MEGSYIVIRVIIKKPKEYLTINAFDVWEILARVTRSKRITKITWRGENTYIRSK